MTASIIDIRLLDRARHDIGKEIEAKQDQLAAGLADDFSDYRYRVGQIKGLTAALEMLGDIIKSMGDGRP